MKRHKFNLSHYKLGTADMGKLYPISCYEALPGDTIQQGSSVFLRFAPMLGVPMHPVRVGLYTFYVPLRLLWDDFEDFITGGPDGLDTSTPPTIQFSNGTTQGSIVDYLGVPTGYTGTFSALPSRAYFKIYNEYFRDQDLVSESTEGNETNGGNFTYSRDPKVPLALSWEKDYFTTARPWPQKGAEVTVPVEGLQTAQGDVNISNDGSILFRAVNASDSSRSYNVGALALKATGDGGSTTTSVTGPTTQYSSYVDTTPADAGLFSNSLNGSQNAYLRYASGLKATFTGTGDTSTGNVRLDALREAFALQRFQEHRAMYGSRYTEYLRYLGIRSSDARLQRPEYLGGGKSTVQFSEVLQSAADGDNPVGTLRGHGVGVVRTKNFRRFIEEHGLIMTLMSVRPISVYQNGLNKMFSRSVKEDYWQRELEHIGQQEVLTKELYANVADPTTVFGYNNRYDEYRSVPSTVCGEMRSTLNYWHMARDFANAPVLNSSFVTGSPTKRIFAEQTMNEIYFMAQHNVVARRILSKQGNPIL